MLTDQPSRIDFWGGFFLSFEILYPVVFFGRCDKGVELSSDDATLGSTSLNGGYSSL
ncbi:hypothetical protein FHS11_001025 [Mucilaginibacter gotjawali]|uniref:Uncharacterized protein n=1 Tax=Mucilaginibacter gotjawali TaxID=1550579 RepID=A0A839S9E8_9SPHI|nr:hypothetical protein [Mucilaginibacter gotjawali]